MLEKKEEKYRNKSLKGTIIGYYFFGLSLLILSVLAKNQSFTFLYSQSRLNIFLLYGSIASILTSSITFKT